MWLIASAMDQNFGTFYACPSSFVSERNRRFSNDTKIIYVMFTCRQSDHKRMRCSASDYASLISTRSYHSMLLITTPTTSSLVKTSLKSSSKITNQNTRLSQLCNFLVPGRSCDQWLGHRRGESLGHPGQFS